LVCEKDVRGAQLGSSKADSASASAQLDDVLFTHHTWVVQEKLDQCLRSKKHHYSARMV
jgi:hypothetical protein